MEAGPRDTEQEAAERRLAAERLNSDLPDESVVTPEVEVELRPPAGCGSGSSPRSWSSARSAR